jgi:hypothetical protein
MGSEVIDLTEYLFEVMSSETDVDVLSYLTSDEVTEHMIGIQMRVL